MLNLNQTIPIITCCYCGNSFPINKQQIRRNGYSLACPYCEIRMNSEMVRQLSNVINSVSNLNQDFLDNGAKHGYQFQLGFENKDVKFPPKNR